MTEINTGTTTSAVTPFTFQSTTFEIVDRDGQPWLRGTQIGDSLGYAKAGRVSIDKLYKSNADEFTDAMTALVKLPDLQPRAGDAGQGEATLMPTGQLREVRIFSLRGAHLLAMFARTAVAKLFRVWVLDLIEKHGNAQPLPTATITPAQCQHLRELVQLVVESGKQSFGETWNRLHRKMGVNSYLLLTQGQFNAACAYLQAKMDDTSMAALVQKHFPDATKRLSAPPAWVQVSIDWGFVTEQVKSGRCAGSQLTDLAQAASHELFAQTCNKPKGIGEDMARQITRDMPLSDLHTIATKATMELSLRCHGEKLRQERLGAA